MSRLSQNGWSTDLPRSVREVVPGVRIVLADGPAGDVLVHVARQIHARVQPITGPVPDDWGYADRNVKGSSDVSNHASGTAFDYNALQHPLGVRDTWTPKQVAEIHRILREVDSVVRWGGDYSGRVDEMHFEIVGDPAHVYEVAALIKKGQVNDVSHVNTLSKAALDAIASAVLNRRLPADFGQPSLVMRRVLQRGASLDAAILAQLKAQGAVIDKLLAGQTNAAELRRVIDDNLRIAELADHAILSADDPGDDDQDHAEQTAG